MIIARSLGLLFIKTMKTAGTSIEIALSPYLQDGDFASPLEPDEEQQRSGKNVRRAVRNMTRTLRMRSNAEEKIRYPHHGFDVAEKYFSEEIDGCHAFCVERNPYDKAVSAFHFLYHRRNRPITDTRIQFAEFCQSPRLASFSNFDMYTRDGELVVNEVLEYDKLDRQFSALMGRKGINDPALNSKTAKAGLRPRLDLDIYYGVDYELSAARLVEHAFAREFEFFGYERPKYKESSV